MFRITLICFLFEWILLFFSSLRAGVCVHFLTLWLQSPCVAYAAIGVAPGCVWYCSMWYVCQVLQLFCISPSSPRCSCISLSFFTSRARSFISSRLSLFFARLPFPHRPSLLLLPLLPLLVHRCLRIPFLLFSFVLFVAMPSRVRRFMPLSYSRLWRQVVLHVEYLGSGVLPYWFELKS